MTLLVLRNRAVDRPIAAPPRRGYGDAWGAMIGPGTRRGPAPSMMPVTDRGNATYGHSGAVRGHPITSITQKRTTTHIAAPRTAVRFQPGHYFEGLGWFRKPEKFWGWYGSDT